MIRNTAIPESVFSDVNFNQYIVQYQGEIEKDFSTTGGFYITPINDKYAILITPKNYDDPNILRPIFKSIVYIKPSDIFTLSELSPKEASEVNFLQANTLLNLTGRGVDVAIIDSGIDYLNTEFMNPTGETRIEVIWDQTIISNSQDQSSTVPYGKIYSKKNIQDAINASNTGKSPYEIVPSVDEVGHGTGMAGIIGATGKNPLLAGVVPECNFVVVKLLQDLAYKSQFNVEVPVYNIASIFSALQFLYEYSLDSNKPMVIYLPLESNFGNHKGNSLLEEFIDLLSSSVNFIVVCASGNQGTNGTHTSGVISDVGGVSVIELEISPQQRDLFVEIWTELPNIMSLDIISPSGENTGLIPFMINATETYSFTFELTKIKVNYYLPEENSGDELIRVRFYGLQPGIWRLRLTANSVLSGRYDAWLPTSGITLEGTRFSLADYYGTISIPATSKSTVTAAGYNQTNNNILNYSGRALLSDFVDVIDVAAGAVNTLTVAPNNKTTILNGTSVAAAILAGVCAILFQWGIVEGNETTMYVQTMKSYLIKGTNNRMGDVYPNPHWGYGILNVVKIFQNLT